jgi:hypothetical protein
MNIATTIHGSYENSRYINSCNDTLIHAYTLVVSFDYETQLTVGVDPKPRVFGSEVI